MKSKKKFNVVSGWNRGGTSVLMATLRECGLPVLGFKYPFSTKFDYQDTKTGKIIKAKVSKDCGMLDPLDGIQNVNKSGFWEISSIAVGGNGLQKEHMHLGNDGNLVKIPLNGLNSSNAKLINKVVVITRNPAQVISSQLKTNNPENYDYWTRKASLGMMYNFMSSINWMGKKKIKYFIVSYELLLEKPEEVLEYVCKFFERGEAKWGARIVDKKFNRSKPIPHEFEETNEVMDFWRNDLTDFQYDYKRVVEVYKRIKKIDHEYSKTN